MTVREFCFSDEQFPYLVFLKRMILQDEIKVGLQVIVSVSVGYCVKKEGFTIKSPMTLQNG
jgi:hypothetical protein